MSTCFVARHEVSKFHIHWHFPCQNSSEAKLYCAVCSGCTNVMGWKDQRGRDCSMYERSVCNDGAAPSWVHFLADVAGVDASQACCACGKSGMHLAVVHYVAHLGDAPHGPWGCIAVLRITPYLSRAVIMFPLGAKMPPPFFLKVF